MRLEIYKGKIEDLCALAEPVWNRVYRNKVRHDMFALPFLKVASQSCEEFLPLVLREDEGEKEILCMAFFMGYWGSLAGKPVRIAFGSWLTALKGHPQKIDTAKIFYHKAKDFLKERGYDLVTGILDTDSHSTSIVSDKTQERGERCALLPKTTPLVKVMDRETMGHIRATKTEKLLFHLIHGFSSPKTSGSFKVEEVLDEKERLECEKYLIEAQQGSLEENKTFFLNYEKLPSVLGGNPFQRAMKVLDLEKNNKVVAYFHLLDIDLLGEERIKCYFVERSWFAKEKLKPIIKSFLEKAYADGIRVVVVPQTFSKRERFGWMRAGLLPDLERPQRVFVSSMKKHFHSDLNNLSRHNLIFR